MGVWSRRIIRKQSVRGGESRGEGSLWQNLEQFLSPTLILIRTSLSQVPEQPLAAVGTLAPRCSPMLPGESESATILSNQK